MVRGVHGGLIVRGGRAKGGACASGCFCVFKHCNRQEFAKLNQII